MHNTDYALSTLTTLIIFLHLIDLRISQTQFLFKTLNIINMLLSKMTEGLVTPNYISIHINGQHHYVYSNFKCMSPIKPYGFWLVVNVLSFISCKEITILSNIHYELTFNSYRSWCECAFNSHSRYVFYHHVYWLTNRAADNDQIADNSAIFKVQQQSQRLRDTVKVKLAILFFKTTDAVLPGEKRNCQHVLISKSRWQMSQHALPPPTSQSKGQKKVVSTKEVYDEKKELLAPPTTEQLHRQPF